GRRSDTLAEPSQAQPRRQRVIPTRLGSGPQGHVFVYPAKSSKPSLIARPTALGLTSGLFIPHRAVSSHRGVRRGWPQTGLTCRESTASGGANARCKTPRFLHAARRRQRRGLSRRARSSPRCRELGFSTPHRLTRTWALFAHFAKD